MINNHYHTISICVNLRAGDMLPSCGARDSKDIAEKLQQASDDQLIPYQVKTVHCLGQCHLGPTARLLPAGPFLLGMKLDDIDEFIELLGKKDIETLKKRFPGPEKMMF